MTILCLDASSSVASVCIGRDNKILCSIDVECGLTHSQRLMSMVDEAVALAAVTKGDIDLLAVSVGPGSFTGVRIGIATAMGIASGLGKKVVPVCSLTAMAYCLPHASGVVVPMLDARRAEVYAAAYRWEGDAPIEVLAPRAAALGDILSCEELSGQSLIALGDGARANEQTLRERGVTIPCISASMERGAALFAAALGRAESAVEPGMLEAMYLRASQAEQSRMRNGG